MKTRILLKEIKGVFIPPKKKYYLGKLAHGTPYFYPMNFTNSIIKVRKLKLRDEEDYQKIISIHPWLRDRERFINLPMVRRSKDWIFKLFGNHYWLQIGYPFAIRTTTLGWKDKFGSCRFEWAPAFQIFFFNWQFCMWWIAPDRDIDLYYEMILWYLHYANKDIVKAEKTWNWVNYETKLTTWDNKYLIKKI